MQNIKLHVLVRGGYINLSHNPLDSILCGMLYHSGQTGEEAMLGGGLYDMYGDIPMASCPLYGGDTVEERRAVIMNNSAAVGDQMEFSDKIVHSPYYKKSYENIMNHYPVRDRRDGQQTIEFFVRGEFEEIRSLMMKSHFMGKKRSVGYGEIMDVQMTEMSDATPHHGITAKKRNGEIVLVRPVPENRFGEFGVVGEPILGHGRYSSPYSPDVCLRNGYDNYNLAYPS